MLEKNKNINKNRIIGIEILRLILCYWVVSYHYINRKYVNHKYLFFIKTKFYHVPCFTFISFYFTSNLFISRDIERIKNRFERLFIPYFIYPVFIFLINNFFFLCFGFNIFNRIITLYELFVQLICSTPIMGLLWFLFSSINITIILTIFSLIFKSNVLYILEILSVLFIFLQYSNIDLNFDNYSYQIGRTLRNTISQIPLAISGLSFAKSNLIDYLKNYKNIEFISLINCLLVFFIFKNDVFRKMRTYNGIENIFSSYLFFIGFYFLPIHNINKNIIKIIKLATKYTQGIYCTHIIIGKSISLLIDNKSTLIGASITYIVSYMISFLSSHIFRNTKLKYLFI